MRNSKNKCYIIGSGIAGIAGAIRLAVKGFEVSIFEKNNYPGGKLTAFEKDGFHFDAGPSLFVEPENIEEIFSFAGEKIEEFLTYSPINISCKYFFVIILFRKKVFRFSFIIFYSLIKNFFISKFNDFSMKLLKIIRPIVVLI